MEGAARTVLTHCDHRHAVVHTPGSNAALQYPPVSQWAQGGAIHSDTPRLWGGSALSQQMIVVTGLSSLVRAGTRRPRYHYPGSADKEP